ncbi:hypothetical protein [Spirosoma foliorum]|uniref:DUF2281 domain-containing protein n=1 Tax=Spirosoma foliorum TaxID=2710596 RepID=A0A7G5GRD6_9BACT|nr:hypothetical protein [Spirosoma foliorum]QMW01428.1 hypothetical protein H3H32_26220 [Spirosoma foliorum]
MLATVTGTYKNGQIILDEELPVKSENAKVIVTLVEDTVENQEKPKRTSGLLKGAFVGEYWFSKEFNDPLDDLKDYM